MNYCKTCGREIPEGFAACPECEKNKAQTEEKPLTETSGPENTAATTEKPVKKKKKTKKARFDFDAAVRKADELFEGIEIGDSIFEEKSEPSPEVETAGAKFETKPETKPKPEITLELLKTVEALETPKREKKPALDARTEPERSASALEEPRIKEKTAEDAAHKEKQNPDENEKNTVSAARTETEKQKQTEKKPDIDLAKTEDAPLKAKKTIDADDLILEKKPMTEQPNAKVLRLFEAPEEDAAEQDEEKVKEKTAPRQNKKEAVKKDAKLKKEKKKPTAEKSGDKGEIGEKIAAFFARVKGFFINPTEDETERETYADASEPTGAPPKNTEPAAPSGTLDDANETTPAPEGGATLFDLEMPKGDLQLTAKKREHAKGALEYELEEDENEVEEDRRYGRAVITVAAAVVALLVGLGIYAAATAATKEPVASDGVMLEYLEGEWLSEQYSYKEDETVFYRELLSINEDETFSISYFIDDGANPEGYRDGTWTKTDSMQGIIAFNDADSSIFLRFEKLGENKEFVRYLLNTTDDTMTLREYYDKLKTDFYDVGFTRVG